MVVLKERLGRDKIDHQSREKAKKLNVKPEQIIILAHISPSMLFDDHDAESFKQCNKGYSSNGLGSFQLSAN